MHGQNHTKFQMEHIKYYSQKKKNENIKHGIKFANKFQNIIK